MENSTNEQRKQTLTLTSRAHLSLDGVKDVKSFDETFICLETNHGKMNIEGKNLRVTKYLMNTGEIIVEGVIDALIYYEQKEEKKSLFSKLTR